MVFLLTWCSINPFLPISTGCANYQSANYQFPPSVLWSQEKQNKKQFIRCLYCVSVYFDTATFNLIVNPSFITATNEPLHRTLWGGSIILKSTNIFLLFWNKDEQTKVQTSFFQNYIILSTNSLCIYTKHDKNKRRSLFCLIGVWNWARFKLKSESFLS
jgi:hypothetical protein